mmetsp:Transcript_2014/g.3128  ORF Transcript_2014/g.3128 Transcript_2014/m.3128 type:complete len:219 (-) Transcript_2014:228-884(-)
MLENQMLFSTAKNNHLTHLTVRNQQWSKKSKPTATSWNAPAKSLNANAHVWSIPTRPAPQSSVAKPATTTQTTQVPPKPTALPSYKPKPGSWASMTVGKAKPKSTQWGQPSSSKSSSSSVPMNNRPTKATNARPMVSPRPTPQSPSKFSPSPDWRTHTLSSSPRRNVAKIPPPPIVSQSAPMAWPGLGDFPPPPGPKSKEQKAKPKQQKSMGAWGRAS